MATLEEITSYVISGVYLVGELTPRFSQIKQHLLYFWVTHLGRQAKSDRSRMDEITCARLTTRSGAQSSTCSRARVAPLLLRRRVGLAVVNG